MKSILHVTIDDKFFNAVFDKFKSDPGYDAEAVVFIDAGCKPKYIASTENVYLISAIKEFEKIIKRKNYDIVFFYPFPPIRWPLIQYVSKNSIVIWWAWGYDLYSPYFSCPPLIRMDSLKKKTKQVVKGKSSFIDIIRTTLRNIRNFAPSVYLLTLRRRVLSRIDFFMPVIDVEWDILRKKYKCFNAHKWNFEYKIPEVTLVLSNKPDGNILVGNSASYYNNHCDVWDIIKQCKRPKGRFVFPLSYGDQKYSKKVIDYIDKDCLVLASFMSPDDYWRIVDSCAYAVFGAMRQHAIGNVFHCFATGIKVFMFKDSMSYKYFKDKGFYVYTIEGIGDNSFCTPLSQEQAVHNQQQLICVFSEKNQVYSRFYNTYVNA